MDLPHNPAQPIIFCQHTACQQAVGARDSVSGCLTCAPAFCGALFLAMPNGVSGCLLGGIHKWQTEIFAKPSSSLKSKMEQRRLAAKLLHEIAHDWFTKVSASYRRTIGCRFCKSFRLPQLSIYFRLPHHTKAA